MEQEISKKLTVLDEVQTAIRGISLMVPTQNILNQNISVYTLASKYLSFFSLHSLLLFILIVSQYSVVTCNLIRSTR